MHGSRCRFSNKMNPLVSFPINRSFIGWIFIPFMLYLVEKISMVVSWHSLKSKSNFPIASFEGGRLK